MKNGLRDIGFWEYTCPGHGSVEGYSCDEWDTLLDDMSSAGCNSLVLGIKWLTTGYRSRFEWLDQDPGAATIASDNATLYHALNGARQRGMRVWLLVVGSIFNAESFGLSSLATPQGVGSIAYDLDQPGVGERILALFEEIAQLFGALADGIIVELEFCDGEAPHRIPLYDRWAAKNGRMSFADLKKIPLEPRGYPQFDWRDYTTSRRIEMLRQIEGVVRQAGFKGTLSNLIEVANGPGIMVRNVNLEMMRDALAQWPLVTYDSVYNRHMNRASSMEFCIEEPHRLGFEVQFVTRGVMTFMYPPDLPPLDLEEQWRMSLEDAAQYQPEAIWFMGSDARSDGMVCNKSKLPQWGFESGVAARRKLLQMVAHSGLAAHAGSAADTV